MDSLKEERKTTGWAAKDPSGLLSPYTFTLRKTGEEDVLIKVIYCGVCHTDVHQIKNDYGTSNYPMVPGFVVKIPKGLAPEQVAPLLCAGVTVYSPLSHFGLKKSGLRGGILGLGGVGHMGVLIAKAMGHHVTVISSSDKKREEAMNVLGANEYLISSDTANIQVAADSLDYLIDTVPIPHPMDDCISLLKLDGKLILLGVVNVPLQFLFPLLMSGRKTITGTFIGSMKEIEELLEFCNEKGVKSSIEVVKMEYINTAMERLANNDVRYRFVVDVAASKLED